MILGHPFCKLRRRRQTPRKGRTGLTHSHLGWQACVQPSSRKLYAVVIDIEYGDSKREHTCIIYDQRCLARCLNAQRMSKRYHT